MQKEIERQLMEHQQVMAALLDSMTGKVGSLADELVECFRRGNKLLVMGNGGSAADAQHFAGEIVSRFRMERRALPAIALSTDTSILTAIGNDYGFERVFVRQVEALASAGDLVIGISTSGSSKNVLLAMDAAAAIGCRTVALVGGAGGPIAERADLQLVVPSNDTPRIQEAHITIIHIVCDLVEKKLFTVSGP
jgi:D-sedoheptulose 7-phosphate isomerase